MMKYDNIEPLTEQDKATAYRLATQLMLGVLPLELRRRIDSQQRSLLRPGHMPWCTSHLLSERRETFGQRRPCDCGTEE